MSKPLSPRRQKWEACKADPQGTMASILDYMSHGGSLPGWCKQEGLAYVTVDDWIRADKGRAEVYARARESRADWLAEEIMRTIDAPVRLTAKGDLDPADVAQKRLKVDTLKWIASKLFPQRYAERIDTNVNVTHDVVGELRQVLSGQSRLPLKESKPPVVLDNGMTVEG